MIELAKWVYRVWLFSLALLLTGSTTGFVFATRGLVTAIVFVVICWGAECFAYDLVLRRLKRR